MNKILLGVAAVLALTTTVGAATAVAPVPVAQPVATASAAVTPQPAAPQVQHQSTLDSITSGLKLRGGSKTQGAEGSLGFFAQKKLNMECKIRPKSLANDANLAADAEVFCLRASPTTVQNLSAAIAAKMHDPAAGAKYITDFKDAVKAHATARKLDPATSYAGIIARLGAVPPTAQHLDAAPLTK